MHFEFKSQKSIFNRERIFRRKVFLLPKFCAVAVVIGLIFGILSWFFSSDTRIFYNWKILPYLYIAIKNWVVLLGLAWVAYALTERFR